MRNKSKDENDQYLQGLWNEMEEEKNDHNIEIVKKIIDLKINKEKKDVHEGLLEIKGRLAIYERTSEKSNQNVKNIFVNFIPVIISAIALYISILGVIANQLSTESLTGQIIETMRIVVILVVLEIILTLIYLYPFSSSKIFLKWGEYTKIYIDDRLKEFEQETINHEHQNQVGGGEKTLNHGDQIKKEPAETADSYR